MTFQCCLGGRQSVASKRVVLVHNGDVLPCIPNQAVDDLLNLHPIAGPEVEHHAEIGVAQKAGPTQRRDEWDPFALDQRQDALGGRRADVAEESQQCRLPQQRLRIRNRFLRLILIVQAREFDGAAMDATLTVHLLEPGEGTGSVFTSKLC